MTLDRFLNVCSRISNSIWVRNYVVSYCGHMVIEIADLSGEGFDKIHMALIGIGFELREEMCRCGAQCRTYAIKRSHPTCISLNRAINRTH